MKAVVFHGIGDSRLDDVAEPKIEQPTDALVRLTDSTIYGKMAQSEPGQRMGHEFMGIIEEIGPEVHEVMEAALLLRYIDWKKGRSTRNAED